MSRVVRKLRKRIARLERRTAFLKGRIDAWHGSKVGLDHTVHELASLEWALPILQEHVDEMAAAEQADRAAHAEQERAAA